MQSEVDPPPVISPPKKRRFGPRFNTASLLGVMALVAVGCVVAMQVSGLLAYLISLAATVLLVAYVALLVAGAFTASGNRRLFAIAAGAGLVISIWGAPQAMVVNSFLNRGGLSPVMSTLLWGFIAPLQHMALSVFAGWVAVRTTSFWESDTI